MRCVTFHFRIGCCFVAGKSRYLFAIICVGRVELGMQDGSRDGVLVRLPRYARTSEACNGSIVNATPVDE